MKNAASPILGLLLLSLAATLCLQRAARAQEAAEPVVIVTFIQGELAESMMATLDRAITRAENAGAEALIVEIDTPGGEVTLMDRLARRIEMTSVQPIAYVTNEAVSAGAFIAMACDLIYTYQRAQIGSSYPIMLPLGLPVAQGGDEKILEKQLSYLRSKFRDRAQSHDRPGMAALAEAMVDPDIEVLLVRHGQDEVAMKREEFEDLVRGEGQGAAEIVRTICPRGELLNLTAQEAFDLGFSDGIVLSREELLEARGIKNARVIEVRASWSERMVGFVEHVQWLLLVAGLVLLYVEMKIPGFGVPGTLGIICLALLLFRNYLVGLAEIPEILLVLLGLALIAVEVFLIPGFGVAGVAGITCLTLGVVFSFLPFLVPDGPFEVHLLTNTISWFSATLVATLIGAYLLSRYLLPRTPVLSRMILDTGIPTSALEGSAASLNLGAGEERVRPGDRGSAVSHLRPAGKVEVDGKLLDAVSQGDYINQGERIVVVQVEANHVIVRSACAAMDREGTA